MMHVSIIKATTDATIIPIRYPFICDIFSQAIVHGAEEK